VKISRKITALLLMGVMNQPNCYAETNSELRIEIAIKITPFIEVKHNPQTITYCIKTNEIQIKTLGEIKKIASEIKPVIEIKVNDDINSITCHFLLIDKELPSDILLATQNHKNSAIFIAYGKNAIQYGADIAIIRSGNKYEIILNTESIKKKGATPHPQLLKIAKGLVKP
jgi:hypothetical protein